MKKIEVIRASKLARPMKCAGSLFFEGLKEKETNQAAKEGTAFGECLAHILQHQHIPSHATNGVPIDAEMKLYANELAGDIFNRAGGVDQHTEILCEQKIRFQTPSGIWIEGSSDASYEQPDTLCIDDAKYGYGIVDVMENWQLLTYAIGEVIRRGKHFKFIKLRILQPRPHHEDGPIREWIITYDQLLDYKNQIDLRCEQISKGFAELSTGTQCKYCPAAEQAACTAFNRSFHHGVDYVMNHFQQDSLTEKEIAFQLDLVARIEDVLKIKASSIKELAINKIQNGEVIPGYMTEPSYGDRKWKKNITPEVIKVLTGKDIVEQVMLSPAKAETLGVPKDLVKTYVDRHFIGNKLVKKDATKLAEKAFGKMGK